MRKLLTLSLLACVSACAPTLSSTQANAIEKTYESETDACVKNAKTKAEGQACLDAVKVKWGRQ